MAPLEDIQAAAPASGNPDLDEWVQDVDDISAKIHGIIDGTITDFDDFDYKMQLKARAKEIRIEEEKARRQRLLLYGTESKGEGKNYKWWCKRCFVQYSIDLEKCTRCEQSDKMMTPETRRDELMGKLGVFKEEKVKHQWRKDKWLRWKKSQALLGRSRNINYKAWEFWEPDTDTENEGEPIVPRENPEFQAMEADMKARRVKNVEKAKTAEKCRQRGNDCMKEGDFIGAIEHYEEGLEYKRDAKALWTNKALAEIKVFRWHDAIKSCNKVIEYSEIFEEGFTRSADFCFKAFVRRAMALRALQKWDEAVEDLEDALKLFPKDRDVQDLYEKTKAASEEAKRAQQLQELPEATHRSSSSRAEAKASGPVRVQIEESDDDEALETVSFPTSAKDSLAGLSKADFSALFKRLQKNEAERVLFCARKGGDGSSLPRGKADQWVGRKLEIKVEEVPEASKLDAVLRDAERCSLLFKKWRGVDEKTQDPDNAREKKEGMAFVNLVAPRLVAVLLSLARCSDHHCALTAPAIRHVWPLLANESWRQEILELLMEWSQRSISGKTLAEFAGRYPDPHVRLLIDAAASDAKDTMLPPGFEERARKATQRLENGVDNLDAAIEDLTEGFKQHSPTELAVSTLGNLCLAGQNVAAFREEIAKHCGRIVSALQRHLRPMDWRLAGRAAGALCNVLRLGAAFVEAVHEKCLEPLVAILREESKADGPASMLQVLAEGDLPIVPSTAKVLGALVNLFLLRPASMQQAREEMGLFELGLKLINPEAAASSAGGSGNEDENGPAIISARASLMTSRLLSAAPAELAAKTEAELLRKVFRRIERCSDLSQVRAGVRNSSDAAAMAVLETVELSVRMLVIVLTKTPGALDRLVERRPRFEELDAGASDVAPAPAIPFSDLTTRLMDLLSALQLPRHLGADEEGGVASRLRANLGLLIGALSEAQCEENVPPALQNLNLSAAVDIFVDSLRKERGAAQQNIGIALTKLAQNPRYKQKVRDLNGIESLHQIQLPKVEREKAEESRKHRLETSEEAKRAELLKLRQQRPARGGV